MPTVTKGSVWVMLGRPTRLPLATATKWFGPIHMSAYPNRATPYPSERVGKWIKNLFPTARLPQFSLLQSRMDLRILVEGGEPLGGAKGKATLSQRRGGYK
ncbi:hypothetical protein CRG98_043309 [Punica granatum]|uniref:Uncharacterized protein n=1 Tax=Punica granatum TaxID=22663 RepID=A0A2I0HXD9_PUNGR|nr:hypothetical protein CRG98_043309 [Punica granatum]